MQEIYRDLEWITEKLESEDEQSIIEGIKRLNMVFRTNYSIEEGYVIYSEIKVLIPFLVDILKTTKSIQVINSIKSISKRFTTSSEMYDALIEIFNRSIEESNTSLGAGRYLVNFTDKLIETQEHYINAIQSEKEYMRLMGLKLLYEFVGNVNKGRVVKEMKSKTPRRKIHSEPNSIAPTSGLIKPEMARIIFLDIAATDKSPQARGNAWSFAGGKSNPENVEYLLDDILKLILYDIVIQFQEGIQVQLTRIIDLIGSEPYIRLKELVTSINESNVKITEEKVIKALQDLIADEEVIGTYFDMEQVFVLGKIKHTQFKPKNFRKNFLCLNCAHPIVLETKKCSNCQKEITRCMVCKRPISFGEEIATCPKCQNKSHKVHLNEWIKVKGKCPICSAKLTERDIA